LDAPVVLFTSLVTLACALLSGLLPAWRQSGAVHMEALKDGARGTARTSTLQEVLVAAQIALSLALTIGGGLLFRSLWNLEHRPLGFQPVRTISFRLSLPWQTDPERVASVYTGVLDRLRATPGIAGAELIDRLPFDGDTQSDDVAIGGRNANELPDGSKIGMRAVSVGFHALLAVPLRAGRYLEHGDDATRRALINETAARQYFNGQSPLGRQIGFRGSKNLYEIVGVVADLPDQLRAGHPEAAMYVPFRSTFWPMAVFVVKTSGPSTAIAADLRREVAAVDPSLAVERLQTLDAFLAAHKQTPRLEAWLVGVFAMVAMLLAGIGIYGLVAGSVEDRRKEIGIRMVLGAEPLLVVRETVVRLLRQMVLGALAGLGLASLLARALQTSLYNVTAGDLGAYAGAVAILSAVALVAAWWPARQAALLDPAEALRD
jgi:putative ABC transport system permease protein